MRLPLVLCLLFLGGIYAQDTFEYPDFDWDTRVPIDDYIAFDDGYFSYTEVAVYEYTDVTVYIYNMTSQSWIGENITDQHVWWHFVGVAIPDDIKYPDAGVLWIDGGRNRIDGSPPAEDDTFAVAIAGFANDTGAVGAFIYQIPNQPIVFKNDPEQRGRSEDDQIAYTWRQYYDDPERDPRILSRYPMTKACSKALDMVNLVAAEKRPETNVERFVVAGGSKRGWTAWVLAGTDRRVIGVAPMVMSLLKYRETLQHHYRSLGGWSFAFRDYWRQNLTQVIYEEGTRELMFHEDPYSYRMRLQEIPILKVSAVGDEFFLLDESWQWWDDFGGNKWLMMNENSHHSLFPRYLWIYENLVAFFTSIVEDVQMPTVEWIREHDDNGGSLTITTSVDPEQVRCYNATSWSWREGEHNRDFRMVERVDDEELLRLVLWDEILEVEDLGDNRYRCYQENDPEGNYVGIVMEATFNSTVDDFYHYFTSETNILPDTYPYDECSGMECYGELR